MYQISPMNWILIMTMLVFLSTYVYTLIINNFNNYINTNKMIKKIYVK